MARGETCREDEIDAADLDAHDRRCARALGFTDDDEGVRQFRQSCAKAIFGGNVEGRASSPTELENNPTRNEPRSGRRDHQ